MKEFYKVNIVEYWKIFNDLDLGGCITHKWQCMNCIGQPQKNQMS